MTQFCWLWAKQAMIHKILSRLSKLSTYTKEVFEIACN